MTINGALILGAYPRQPIGFDYYTNHINQADGGASSQLQGLVQKAFTSTDGSGGDFIPTDYPAQIIKFIYMNSWARQTFGTFTIMSGDNASIPKFSTGLQPDNPDYLSTEITAALGSATYIREDTQTTEAVTLSLKTIANNKQMQRRTLQYSSVNRTQLETMFREEAIKNLIEAEEDAFVNGDTRTTTSNINYTYNATDHPHGYASVDNEWLIVFDGMRRLATGTAVDVGAAAPTAANFRSALKSLGKYAHKGAEKVVFLVSTDFHSAIIGFEQLETLEKYGPKATILTGEAGKIYNHSVIVTDKLPNEQSDTLTNTAGIRSASTGTNLYTEGLAVFTESPIIGVPADSDNALNVTVTHEPGLDRFHMFSREDIAFNVRYPEAIVRMYGVLVS